MLTYDTDQPVITARPRDRFLKYENVNIAAPTSAAEPAVAKIAGEKIR